MKPLPYVLSKDAALDLKEIWLYTVEKWSEEQADRYFALIIKEINYICKNFLAGKSAEIIDEGCRISKVKSHRVIYRVNNGTVEIIRILHERMDIDSLLLGLDP
jgi:toxin ParE1/3/4